MATPLNNSLIRGFEILALFDERRSQITAALVVEQLGMNLATAHRFLTTLEHIGALRLVERGSYALGPRIEDLAYLATGGGAMGALMDPVLAGLSRDLGESAMACRLSPHGPICVAVAEAPRTLSVNIRVGTLLPLHSTAQGRLWLAEMDADTRQQTLSGLAVPAEEGISHGELDALRDDGFAVNLGGNEPDIAAVSVPVRDRKGQMRLSLSVFGMLSRFTPDLIERARFALSRAAHQAGRLI